MSNRLSVGWTVSIWVLAAGLLAHAQQKPATKTAHNKKAALATFVFQLQDGTTSFGVPGLLRLGRTQLSMDECHWSPEAPEPPKVPMKERKADSSGKVEVEVPPGCYAVEVSAPGYKPIGPDFLVMSEHNEGGLNYMLERLQEPEGIQRAEAALRPGITIYYGYVADTKTLQPIAGAEVREQSAGVMATTDAHGFFMLEMPTKSLPDDGCPNNLDTIAVRAAGYKEEIRRSEEIYRDQVTGSNIGLKRGAGMIETGESCLPPSPSAAEINETAKWWDDSPPKPSELSDQWVVVFLQSKSC